MPRPVLAAIVAAVLVVGACGGDSTDEEPTPADGSPATTAAANDETPTPIPTSTTLPPRPEPTPVPSSDPVIRVVAGTQEYTPTRAEFEALPHSTHGGHRGVSLRDLAERMGASAGATVTISGYRAGAGTVVFYRTTVDESGDSSVFVVGEAGHVAFVMPEAAESQWIAAVERVAFD